jgi:hypothetical protein
MFRRLLTTAGVAGIVAFVVGGGAFAAASGSGGGDDQTTRMVVIEKSTSQRYLDLGKRGFSVGDEFFFSSNLWNQARTERVGSIRGYCVILNRSQSHCQVTGHLRGGTIEVAGLVSDSPSSVLAITGGTRAYRDAGGQVRTQNLNDQGTLIRDVIELAN